MLKWLKVLRLVTKTKYARIRTSGPRLNFMGTFVVASRARTTAQKIRSLALRKPFELVKIRAASEIPGATVELDWTMPVRQVWVNGEPVVLQPKECLRGNFVSH